MRREKPHRRLFPIPKTLVGFGGQDNHILAYLTLKGKLPTLGREMIAIVGKEVRVEIMGAIVVGRVIIIVESTSKAREKGDCTNVDSTRRDIFRERNINTHGMQGYKIIT